MNVHMSNKKIFQINPIFGLASISVSDIVYINISLTDIFRRMLMSKNHTLEIEELTDIPFYILLFLVQPKHGYLIMKTIDSMTNGKFLIGPASLYSNIQKLLVSGLIELVSSENKQRKTYQTTEKGIQLLKKEVQRRREMITLAEDILKEKGE